MKIEFIDKWFKVNETLTREQYSTLGSMYDILQDIAIEERNKCKPETPIASDPAKNDIEDHKKLCPKCQTVKPIAEFHKNIKSNDGLQSYCKTCKQSYGNYYTPDPAKKDIEDNNKKNEEDQPASETSNVVKPNDIWTEEEDEIIKKYYPMLSAPAVKREKLPHRSEQAIYDRAYFLKIKKSKPRVQTKKDIEDHKKLCNKCQTVKPIEEFHKNKRSNDGLQPHCKECKKKYYTKDKQGLQEPKEQKKEEIIDWTFKEENLLREKGFKIGFDKLLKLLPGRSEKAIQEKVKLMGMAL